MITSGGGRLSRWYHQFILGCELVFPSCCSCSLKDQRWFGSVVWFGDPAGDGGSSSDPLCVQEVV